MTSTPHDDTEMHGSSHDSSTFYQVAGDYNVYPSGQDTASTDTDTGGTRPGGSGAGGGVLVILAVAAVAIWMLVKASGINDKFIPDSAGTTPASARVAAVQAVRQAIENCATETAPAPATCPQSESGVTETASVRWTLYGDPTDGEVDRFEDGTVYVMGTAIMTVNADASATIEGSALFDVKKVGYYAEVAWDGRHAQLDTIVGSKAAPPEPVTKRSEAYSQQTVLAQVMKFLNKCAAARSADPSPKCPARFTPDGGPKPQEPHWKIKGNPILNARVSFNHDSGLVEVVGQLRLSLYDGTKQRAVYSAPYTAQVYPTSMTSPDVLRITMQN